MNIDKKDVENLREDYQANTLEINEVTPHPMDQFGIWFATAMEAKLREPNAMTLATCTPQGIPSARIILLKGYDQGGFCFYSNYQSRKGQELIQNPSAALVFCWLELQRQVRIEGWVERMSIEDSTTYFQSRPKGSQIGAWASPQSRVISDRSILEENVQELEEQYKEVDQLPCPKHWGGFKLVPEKIEFWQGRSSRLHDRILYTLDENNNWKIERLAP